MENDGYVIVRQQAGPFVKAYATDRKAFVKWNRGCSPGEARRRCGPAMCRTSLDKLEVRLALFGYDGVFYSLTFAPENSPHSFKETKAKWDYFLKKKLRPWLAEQRKIEGPIDIDYVCRIEHLHDHWHLHCFLRDRDFPPAVVRWLWDYGEADDRPWDYKRVHAEGGYRGLAQYFIKEVPEVGRHPWSTNRGLAKQIPPPTISFSRSGQIRTPKGSVLLPVSEPGKTPWGIFQHCRYLVPQNGAFILNN